MKFNGRFKDGVFIPDSSVEAKWKRWVKRLERDDIAVSVALNRAERTSDSQLGLFHQVVKMIAQEADSNEEQVLIYFANRNYLKKSFKEFSTTEMKNFIDKMIIEANEDFGLNIHIELMPDGKANVKAC